MTSQTELVTLKLYFLKNIFELVTACKNNLNTI